MEQQYPGSSAGIGGDAALALSPANCFYALQDWTKQESEDAEGIVTFSYRTAREDSPPDVPTIQKQMAIVAWQPGAQPRGAGPLAGPP